MNIKKVKVFNKNYKIEYCNEIIDDDDRILIGQALFNSHIIKIDKNYDDNEQLYTLFHEIMHCIDDFMHIELSEEQTDQVANGILYILQNNPELLKIIQNKKG
jgi:Zn-dependent peptidase ImmA (M78 family)